MKKSTFKKLQYLLMGVFLMMLVAYLYEVMKYVNRLEESKSYLNTIGEKTEVYKVKYNSYPTQLSELFEMFGFHDYQIMNFFVDPNRKQLLKIATVYDDNNRDSIVGAFIYSSGLYNSFYIREELLASEIKSQKLIWYYPVNYFKLILGYGVVITSHNNLNPYLNDIPNSHNNKKTARP